MWVCAEMALNLLKPPISSNIENPHAQFMEARLPSMFFQKQPDDFSNEKRCLPEKFLGSFINDAVVASVSFIIIYFGLFPTNSLFFLFSRHEENVHLRTLALIRTRVMVTVT